LFIIIAIHSYFIYILKGSVETHLRSGGIYNNHIIAYCLQSVPVKKIENRSIIGGNIDKGKVSRFL